VRSALRLADDRDLKNIEGREVSCYSISAKESMNLEAVFKWLIARYRHSYPLLTTGLTENSYRNRCITRYYIPPLTYTSSFLVVASVKD